jgi:hypothetical protein
MNATQQHPFEAILGWLDSLPPDLRHTIALVVLLHVPDLTKPDDWSDRDGGETVLREWLSPTQRRAATVVGKAVIFRAILCFKCKNFFSKDRQESIREWQLQFREHLVETGNNDFAEKIGDHLQQLPLRQAHWTKAAQSWDRLCDTDLSDGALELYEHENPPRLWG